MVTSYKVDPPGKVPFMVKAPLACSGSMLSVLLIALRRVIDTPQLVRDFESQARPDWQAGLCRNANALVTIFC